MMSVLWFLTGTWLGWKLREDSPESLTVKGDSFLADDSDAPLKQLLVELGPSAVGATGAPPPPPPPGPPVVPVLVPYDPAQAPTQDFSL